MLRSVALLRSILPCTDRHSPVHWPQRLHGGKLGQIHATSQMLEEIYAFQTIHHRAFDRLSVMPASPNCRFSSSSVSSADRSISFTAEHISTTCLMPPFATRASR